MDVRPVTWDTPVAATLREAMTAELRVRYADRADLVRSRVDAEGVVYTGIAYNRRGLPIGHVALRRSGPAVVELEWMYVMPPYRGRGAAQLLLTTAERVAATLGATYVVLRTGDRQPDAVRVYRRNGYTRVPAYPCETAPHTWCFQKTMAAHAAS